MEESNESNGSIIQLESLDEIYRDHVRKLRDLVLKIADANDIELCRKWLKVFHCTSKDEKLARNCLCTLMQHQLKESGGLTEPFTNLNNCNQNLERLLTELDIDTQKCLKTGIISSHSSPKENLCEISPLENCEKYHRSKESVDTIELERELNNLRLQVSEKDLENEKLKDIMEKYNREIEEKGTIIYNMKVNSLNSIREKLMQLRNNGLAIEKIQLFESIFKVYSDDLVFIHMMRKFDMDFQDIIGKYLEFQFGKFKGLMKRQFYRKFLKKKSNLRRKYERRLTMQYITQKLQLKLAKLKCISELRQTFIRTYDYKQVEMMEILNILEEKYDKIANTN